ncbi:hypothetical protein [Nonomuraea pusilla]|uniref:hypothetical protein n=1 Tax=Nonomuraea pusilla TaxID=46177 RepID=UPI000B8821F8|nr:hypothetical protein [Nonomuraea pusilla]
MTSDEREVSDQVLAERLAATIPRVEAGIEAQREQRRIIREMKRRGWPQDRIGRILGVSQQAVSKRLARKPEDDNTTE